MTPTELEYGVIYVFTNLYAPTELLNNYMASAGRYPKYLYIRKTPTA